MEWMTDPTIWASFLSLTALEIVLGIDNVIFLALVVQHLPPEQRKKARFIGLSLAFAMRVVLLFSVVWILGLTEPLITLFDKTFSGRDLMMLAGGGLLIYKAVGGMREEMTHQEEKELKEYKGSYTMTITQIIFVDLIFSFDSVITAVGLTENLYIIVAAMAIAIGVMLASATFISEFIEQNPTVKVLAYSFIMLVGVFLCAEGMGTPMPKGYIYFGMAFSLGVEILNMLVRKKQNKG
jgi:predicted tellurium resistance membrane protein TerC